MSKKNNNPNKGRDPKPDTFGKKNVGDSKKNIDEIRKGSEIPPSPTKPTKK